jgi:dimethylglycine dehydrogenase
MLGVDPRRFGPYATRGYLKAKNEEAYANVFTLHYPRRGTRRRTAAEDDARATTACGRSARCSVPLCWERPNWFAPDGYEVPASELDVDDTLHHHNHAPADGSGKVRERWSFRRSITSASSATRSKTSARMSGCRT